MLRRCAQRSLLFKTAPSFALGRSTGAFGATSVCLPMWQSKRFYCTPSDEGQAKTFTYNRSKMSATAKDSTHQDKERAAEAAAAEEEMSEDDAPRKGYNPWEVLGLKPGAPMHDVRVRYHDLLKRYHPSMVEEGEEPSIAKVNEINKAYETITKAPTLDKRYKGLVTDAQYFYYKILPDWMARNVDEMPRYYNWIRWRVGDFFFLYLVLMSCAAIGGYYISIYPKETIVVFVAFFVDCLFHTLMLPVALFWLAIQVLFTGPEKTLAWLTSPRSFLQRGLMY